MNKEQIITLLEDNKKEVHFEVLAVVQYEKEHYAILLPYGQDDGVIILKIEENIDGSESYCVVEDEKILNEVFRLFND